MLSGLLGLILRPRRGAVMPDMMSCFSSTLPSLGPKLLMTTQSPETTFLTIPRYTRACTTGAALPAVAVEPPVVGAGLLAEDIDVTVNGADKLTKFQLKSKLRYFLSFFRLKFANKMASKSSVRELNGIS